MEIQAIALMALAAAFAFGIFLMVCMWRVYTKAGLPGWTSLIPFLNLYLWLKIGGKSGWWMLLYVLTIIPFIGVIVAIVINILVGMGVSRRFGRGDGFGVLIGLAPIIGIPILALDDSLVCQDKVSF